MDRRVILIILLVISILCMAAYAREGASGPLHSAQSVFQSIGSPLQHVGTKTDSATTTMSNKAEDVFADANTLQDLKSQNEQLRAMVSNAEEYRQEVERLEGLLNMKTTSGVEGKGARVIGRSLNAWDSSITINLGSNDSVMSGMTVMGSSGVIGQVVSVEPSRSTVRLLTDPNSGAAVVVQSSRVEGIVRGSLEGLLYLEDMPEDNIPSVGDVVITSGLGGSYVPGLIVGTVVRVNKTLGNASGAIVVDPNDDFSMAEEVFVVMEGSDTEVIREEPDKTDLAASSTGGVTNE